MNRSSKSALLLACLLGAGCQTTPAPPPGPSGQGINPSVLAALDPSAQRMDDIRAAMLLYCRQHNRLPDRLDDLRPFAVAGPLQFTSSVSGKPYLYVPEGLPLPAAPGAPNPDQRLVLYDAAPGSDGLRWAILMAPPNGNRPLTTWVVQLDERTLQSCLKSAKTP